MHTNKHASITHESQRLITHRSRLQEDWTGGVNLNHQWTGERKNLPQKASEVCSSDITTVT
jgi:hypothetical protein